MGRLIYSMNVSLDGYVATPSGGLEWSIADDELHRLWKEQLAGRDASLYGRRIYELMSAYWPTAKSDPAATPAMLEFAEIWNALPKVVFSRTLQEVSGKSRLVRGDVGDLLRQVRSEYPGDIDVSGPTLAAEFIRRDLIDEYRPVVHPVVLGAGIPFVPALETPLRLQLADVQRLSSGVVCLTYAARNH